MDARYAHIDSLFGAPGENTFAARSRGLTSLSPVLADYFAHRDSFVSGTPNRRVRAPGSLIFDPAEALRRSGRVSARAGSRC